MGSSVGGTLTLYYIVVVKPEGKMPLGRPRRRWDHKIRLDLREV